jgi:hypothetical protein
MNELSEKICQINGIIGAAILDQNGEIVATTCLSEMAEEFLEEMAPAMRHTMITCEEHEPALQSLSLKSQDATIIARHYSPWTVCALCQNEQILYLLESAIEAMITEYLQSLENAASPPGQVWLRSRKKQEDKTAKNQISPLCAEILRLAQPYFALSQTAERLILRQIREHLKIRPEDLNHVHLPDLAHWVSSSAGLLLDNRSAGELGNKIRERQ